MFFASSSFVQRGRTASSGQRVGLGQTHPTVCRSSPCTQGRRRATAFGGAQNLACAVSRRTPWGMDVQTCRLQRCVGESMGHPLVCVPSLPVAPSMRCRMGGCPLFLWPILQPIPTMQQAGRSWRGVAGGAWLAVCDGGADECTSVRLLLSPMSLGGSRVVVATAAVRVDCPPSFSLAR
jgi:hypothetical protein